jgi:hypothetical protein
VLQHSRHEILTCVKGFKDKAAAKGGVNYISRGNHCNQHLNPMHYEMRQDYDPVMNAHMNCNHPANLYMVSGG